MTWIIFTVTLLATFQTQSLIVQYEKAYSSEKLTLASINQLEHNHNRTAVETAYLGSFNLLMANHVSSPFSKFAYFQEGKSRIANAIKEDPTHVEIRYLRFINQVETPQILRYKSNIHEDKNFILEHLSVLKGTVEYEQMTKYLHQCSELTDEEKLRIEK